MKLYSFFTTLFLSSLSISLFAMEAPQSTNEFLKSTTNFECPPKCNNIIETGDQIVILQTNNDNNMYLYSKEGKQLKKITPEKEVGWLLVPSPEIGNFATDYADGLALWSIKTDGKPVMEYYTGSDKNPFYAGSDLKFTQDGKYLTFTGRGQLQGLSRSFKVENGEPLETSFLGCDFISQDGERGFSTTFPAPLPNVGSYKPFSKSEDIVKEFNLSNGNYGSQGCDPNLELLASTKDQCTVEIWNTQTGEVVNKIQLPEENKSNFLQLGFSQDGRFLAITVNEILAIYDSTKNFGMVKKLALPQKYSTQKLFFSANNAQLITLSNPESENQTEDTKISPRQLCMLKKLREATSSAQNDAPSVGTDQNGRVDIFDIGLDEESNISVIQPEKQSTLSWLLSLVSSQNQ